MLLGIALSSLNHLFGWYMDVACVLSRVWPVRKRAIFPTRNETARRSAPSRLAKRPP